MATVRLSFSPAPAHVRTARLVGVAVARRAGVPDELLEEIRLAIGEACSRAVALHRTNGVDDLVEVTIDDDERFVVRVIDRAGNGLATANPPTDPALFLSGPPDHAGAADSGGYAGQAGRWERGVDYRMPSPGTLGDALAAGPVGPGQLGAGTPSADLAAESLSEEAVAAGMGLALLAGLVDDLDVSTTGDGGGTEVRMSWPLGRRSGDG